ncbi:mitochondrial escape protein 2 [Rhizina undulata]
MNRYFQPCGNSASVGLPRYPLQVSRGTFFTSARPPASIAREGVWRRTTSTIGENKSGFIDVKPGEGILFFDNIFPLKTAIYDFRYLLMRYDISSVEQRIKKKCLPPSLLSSPDFKITSIIPRLKDGGAFVKFISADPAETESIIKAHLKEKLLKPWFSPFQRVKSHLVRGKPWLEDLYRFPSAKLRVEFVDESGKGLSQETLYALFRRYGKISNIIPQSPASKDLPKFAIIQFVRMRAATAARNCLHGYTVPEMEAVMGKEGGVTLRVLYERIMKAHHIRDWLFSHPKIVVPALAAIIATITVAIFDPVRTWFIKAKITKSLDLSENQYWGWLKKHTMAMLPLRKPERDMDDLTVLWEERRGSIELLKSWLLETSETFIVVQGPRGSGKRELLDNVLTDRKNILVIDCEAINEAHGDSATISAAAAQVGYRPIFSWLNTLSSLLDLAAQGAIGTSAGFSQTLETQFTKILQNTATALRHIALENRGSGDKELGMSDEDYLSAHPESRPVVVIDNFLHTEGDSIIYEKLADWAALLVSANVAHVIFLTNDITFSKSLAKSLPDRVFRSVLLGDAKPELAKRYVLAYIDEMISSDDDVKLDEKHLGAELDESIQALGGRLTDLECLARRIKTGETPKQAVEEIIESSASEILKLYFLDAEVKKRKWTADQAWLLVKELAAKALLRYNEVLLHDLFKVNGEEIIQALEHAEMISVVIENGRPYAIKPGKPVYHAAFGRLLEDNVLKARMDFISLQTLIKYEGTIIAKALEELAVLATLPKQPKGRQDYLLAKVGDAQKRIDEMEGRMKGLKNTLRKDF